MRMENEKDRETYVWPDMAFMEFITAVALTVILIVWSLLVNAPLLETASPGISENPSKAPWYFVGLQELLVYFDPWIAGVMIPAIIILCLALIPYLDTKNTVSGKYSFSGRKFAVTNFLFGFTMWLVLIFTGYFLRGPDWHLYWPWQSWETVREMERELWSPSPFAGLLFLLTYFVSGLFIPRRISKKFRESYGTARYFIVMISILLMYFVPVKIFLRLAFDIKYILVTPWFNI